MDTALFFATQLLFFFPSGLIRRVHFGIFTNSFQGFEYTQYDSVKNSSGCLSNAFFLFSFQRKRAVELTLSSRLVVLVAGS